MTSPASPYAHVSDPMYWLWLGAKEAIPGVRLGGIYANNSGYHNTRRHLLNGWPNSYAIKLDMDKKGSADLASAIDLTMSDAEMRKRTNYLRSSDLHPDDNRLRALREFIGTRDSEHVYCRIAGNEGLGQRHGVYDGTRDKSHLWHIHLSFLRAFAAVWEALEPVLSVLSGETWEQWQARKGDDMGWADKLGTQGWAQDQGLYDGIADKGADLTAGWHQENSNAHIRALRQKDVPALLAGQAAILARVDGADDDTTRQIVADELAKSAERERAERAAELEPLHALMEAHSSGQLDAEDVVRRIGALLSGAAPPPEG